ncbi:MAG: hypothetical protein ABIH76_00330 [Candidatus Bathyarchaeota archaeon]
MVKRKQRKPRKGFNRSAKEWEQSIATHIGKFIDNLDAKNVLDLFTAAICAYGGYRAGEVIGQPIETRLGMAASGVLGYQLAKSMNPVAGASGTVLLASYGLINVWNPLTEAAESAEQAIQKTIYPDQLEKALQELQKRQPGLLDIYSKTLTAMKMMPGLPLWLFLPSNAPIAAAPK